jgi:hypothetical protein
MQLAHFDNFRCRQGFSPRTRIDVSTDGNRRRDGTELFEHFRIADITSMKNQLGTSQSLSRLWPNKAMGI